MGTWAENREGNSFPQSGTRSRAAPAPARIHAEVVRIAATACVATVRSSLPAERGAARITYHAERYRKRDTSARSHASEIASPIEKAPGLARSPVRTAARGSADDR